MSVFDRSPQITGHLLMNQALPHGAQVRIAAALRHKWGQINPSALAVTAQPTPCTSLHLTSPGFQDFFLNTSILGLTLIRVSQDDCYQIG